MLSVPLSLPKYPKIIQIGVFSLVETITGCDIWITLVIFLEDRGTKGLCLVFFFSSLLAMVLFCSSICFSHRLIFSP